MFFSNHNPYQPSEEFHIMGFLQTDMGDDMTKTTGYYISISK